MALSIKKPKSAAVASPVPSAVAGLDVSTKTGVVVFDGDGNLVRADETVLTSLAKGSGAGPRLHRAIAFGEQVFSLLSKGNVRLVAIEGYSHSPFGMAVAVELGTAARFAAFRAGVPLVEVSPATLKKYATGLGRGDKSVVRLGVFKRWGFEHASDNVVDAYVLARIALAMAYGGEVSGADREIIGALRWAKPPVQVIA